MKVINVARDATILVPVALLDKRAGNSNVAVSRFVRQFAGELAAINRRTGHRPSTRAHHHTPGARLTYARAGHTTNRPAGMVRAGLSEGGLLVYVGCTGALERVSARVVRVFADLPALMAMTGLMGHSGMGMSDGRFASLPSRARARSRAAPVGRLGQGRRGVDRGRVEVTADVPCPLCTTPRAEFGLFRAVLRERVRTTEAMQALADEVDQLRGLDRARADAYARVHGFRHRSPLLAFVLAGLPLT